MSDRWLQAQESISANNLPEAYVHLANLIQSQPRNVDAWYLLSTIVSDEKQKKIFLQRALKIDPNHGDAQLAWALLEAPVAQPTTETAKEPPVETQTSTADSGSGMPAWMEETGVRIPEKHEVMPKEEASTSKTPSATTMLNQLKEDSLMNLDKEEVSSVSETIVEEQITPPPIVATPPLNVVTTPTPTITTTPSITKPIVVKEDKSPRLSINPTMLVLILAAIAVFIFFLMNLVQALF